MDATKGGRGVLVAISGCCDTIPSATVGEGDAAAHFTRRHFASFKRSIRGFEHRFVVTLLSRWAIR